MGIVNMKRWALTRRFLRDEDGPTSVEYAVMLALIILTCLATITLMAQTTEDSFRTSTEAIQNAFN